MKPRSRLRGARGDGRTRLVRGAASFFFLAVMGFFVYHNTSFGLFSQMGSSSGPPPARAESDATDATLARSLADSSWLGGSESEPVHSSATAVRDFVAASGQALPRSARLPEALPPPASRTNGTLVLYAYAARDAEEVANFDFFLRFGVAEDGATYRLVLSQAEGVLPLGALPELPPNARYVRVGGCPTSSWATLHEAVPQLAADLARAEHVVVVDSRARGPFLPPYALQALSWTEAFTSRLRGHVRMAGSAISCEGAPLHGDAAGEWRRNPHVMPFAWAVDRASWELLQAREDVWKCHASAWETRYHADVGASLALLEAGGNLDCLLTRYQGVDWWAQANWACNGRVAPDGELTYDGASVSPYEALFVQVDQGRLDNRWTAVLAAVKYGEWLLAQSQGAPAVSSNAFTADPVATKAEKLVYMNARGPGCFDFEYYVKHNPDLAAHSANPLELWEHFLLLGQFQGRTHRFSCPVQMGTSYRIAYQRARGHSCFDHQFYLDKNKDLQSAGLNTGAELFGHYAFFGQFEGRPFRYTCPDTMWNFNSGFEKIQLMASNATNVQLTPS